MHEVVDKCVYLMYNIHIMMNKVKYNRNDYIRVVIHCNTENIKCHLQT